MPLLGTTLSTLKLQELQIPVAIALDEVLKAEFDILRLSAVWKEIQPNNPADFDFAVITHQLEACEDTHQKVVLTIGVKAPRWPEFHFPEWVNTNLSDSETQHAILQFVTTTVQKLQHFSCITHWQIENEPLDPSGPEEVALPFSLLTKEVAALRRLDHRPIVITAWGNDVKQRNTLPQLSDISDIIGLDLYYKQFVFQTPFGSVYQGPRATSKQLRTLMTYTRKPLWITELQAEPWEASEKQYRSSHPQSISPQQIVGNVMKALELQPQAVLLWGVEYWLWRQQQGDHSYFELLPELRRLSKNEQ